MKNNKDVDNLLEKIKGRKILCIGDIILDKFFRGSVDRISPEAPVPIFKILEENLALGGVGNVAANIVSLGAQVFLVGACGKDSDSNVLSSLISKYNNIKSKLILDEKRETITKSRYISSGQHLIRVDKEELKPISVKIENEILKAAESEISRTDAMVLSDYGKGVLTESLLCKLIELANKKNILTIVDPNGRDYAKYKGATIVTPNKLELSLATNESCHTEGEIIKASETLIENYSIKNILVTRSEEGMTLVSSGGEVLSLPSETKEVYDVSGAGDTVVAVLASIAEQKESFAKAAKLSNIAAGLVVSKVGTATINSQELAFAVKGLENKSIHSKIVSLQEAIIDINSWRSNNKKIGFTNGAFDLLHAGHLFSINQTKRKCDKLVVGLNSDASVYSLKGEGRPMQNEVMRSNNLASLNQVDLIIIFNEDTPIELIKEIKPDILTKGRDYSEKNIEGSDFVKSYGGEILLTELLDGYSTTKLINNL